jgi:hypothetical protein
LAKGTSRSRTPGAAADTDHPGFCIAKDLR